MSSEWKEILWDRFYTAAPQQQRLCVEQVPYGCVITYGQIVMLVGHPRHARQVGYALHATPKNRKLPWHRVVNRLGELSPRHDFTARQRELLKKEAVTFNRNGRINMKEHLIMTL